VSNRSSRLGRLELLNPRWLPTLLDEWFVAQEINSLGTLFDIGSQDTNSCTASTDVRTPAASSLCGAHC
jgi:hypothetical protein